MFSTFTGSSRRPRNVNLSGQRSGPQPWTPVTGASNQSVSHAQTERQQRHNERRRNTAARSIQRVWRGHRTRLEFHAEQRRAFDETYGRVEAEAGGGDDHVAGRRLRDSLPLLLYRFDGRNRDDSARLLRWVADAESQPGYRLGPLGLGAGRLRECLWMVYSTLEHGAGDPDRGLDCAAMLRFANHLAAEMPAWPIAGQLPRYYGLMAMLSGGERPAALASETTKAVILPLLFAPIQSGEHEDSAYAIFVRVFLPRPSLPLFESSIQEVARQIDVSRLTAAVISASSISPDAAEKTTNKDGQLNLVARFIGLTQANQTSFQDRLLVAEALYRQLSSLSTEISLRLDHGDDEDGGGGSRGSGKDIADESANSELSPYVKSILLSLGNVDIITDLFRDLANTLPYGTQSSSPGTGCILTLLRCFPKQGDEIRLKLYLQDMPTKQQHSTIPAVAFLWRAATDTVIFKTGCVGSEKALPILRNCLVMSSPQEKEWRTILLFLELYIFLLRLSDDDDFFWGLEAGTEAAAIAGTRPSAAASRLQSCHLTKSDVASLSLFLKNMAFAIYYCIPGTVSDSKSLSRPDFEGLRDLITTGLKLLYERDSRRQFLDQGHWLIPDFPVKTMIPALVYEDRRQHEEDRRRRRRQRRASGQMEEGDADGSDDGSGLDSDNDHDGDSNGDGDGGGGGGDAEADDEFSRDADRYLGQASYWAGSYTSSVLHRARIEQQREAAKREARETARAELAPELTILRKMPFGIQFATRVEIFKQFIQADKLARREGIVDADAWLLRQLTEEEADTGGFPNWRNGRHRANIRRHDMFEDAYENFWPLGESIKEPIQITFLDQFDAPEAGIDGGGVTKEFLTSATTEAFASARPQDGISLFVANRQGLLYPNPAALDQKRELMRQGGILEDSKWWRTSLVELLRRYEFLGRIVGKCMYEGILLDVAFAGFFLLKWTAGADEKVGAMGVSSSSSGRASIVNDLRDMDEELYQGLLALKRRPGPGGGGDGMDIDDLALDFTIDDTLSLPGKPVRTVTRILRTEGRGGGGVPLPVTAENRLLYISDVAHHRLVSQPAHQSAAFLRGLRSVIHPSWLSMFNQAELQRLVGGDSGEIDVEDLRHNTVYGGLYAVGDDGQEHPTVQMFWAVMAEFGDAQRRDVLRYVTSTPRAPLLGFSQLNPRFSIRDSGDMERLPSASTCVNLLKLPRYEDEGTLRAKLLQAISSGAGFELS